MHLPFFDLLELLDDDFADDLDEPHGFTQTCWQDAEPLLLPFEPPLPLPFP